MERDDAGELRVAGGQRTRNRTAVAEQGNTMSDTIRIDHAAVGDLKPAAPGGEGGGTIVVFAAKDGGFADATRTFLGEAGVALIARAAAAAKFKGKLGTALDIVAPHGFAAGKLGRGVHATVLFDLPHPLPDAAVAEFGVGLRLRD